MVGEISREVVKAPLPDLVNNLDKTSSSVLHDLYFVGRIEQWDTFERDALNHFQATNRNGHRQIVAHRVTGPPSEASSSREHIPCGDERGVETRYIHNVCHMLSSVFVAMDVNLVFGDFRANKSCKLGGRIPDIACMSREGELRVIGEMKTPWVVEHGLERATAIGIDHFRHVLGQIAWYMHLSNMKYAFLSTYNQTIFLKQEYNQTNWILYHSRVIYSDDQQTATGASGNANVSIRQSV